MLLRLPSPVPAKYKTCTSGTCRGTFARQHTAPDPYPAADRSAAVAAVFYVECQLVSGRAFSTMPQWTGQSAGTCICPIRAARAPTTGPAAADIAVDIIPGPTGPGCSITIPTTVTSATIRICQRIPNSLRSFTVIRVYGTTWPTLTPPPGSTLVTSRLPRARPTPLAGADSVRARTTTSWDAIYTSDSLPACACASA